MANKKVVTALVLMMLSMATAGFALGLGGDVPIFEDGRKAPYVTFLYDKTPVISMVTQTPEQPMDGQKVKVSAVVSRDITHASQRVKKVEIIFSMDGGATWDSAEMAKSDADPDYYFAFLPPQKAGTKVVYYIQATDISGSKTTEMPGKAIVDKDTLKNFVGVDDVDEPEDSVPADIDVHRLEVGYDDQYLYVHLVTEGKPNKGDPLKKGMNLYLLPVLNLDIIKGGIADLFKVPILAYAPIFSSYLNVEPQGLFKLSEVLQTKKGVEGADVKMKKGDNDLLFRFNIAALGKNESGNYEIAALTAAAKTMDGMLPWEATPFLSFALRNHEYTVSGDKPPVVSFKVGTADADITPPVGTPLSGYGDRQGAPSTGVHDKLMANAIVMEAGNSKYAFVTADFFYMRRILYQDICAKAEKETGIPRDHILISASHSHSSSGGLFPEVAVLGGTYDQKVYDATRDKIAGAIVAASKKMQPAKVGTGKLDVPELNTNRREDGGPTDPGLTVLRFDDMKGTPIAVLYNYSAHPTVMGGNNREYTAEYPGATRKYMAKLFPGATVLFANGSLGNSGPACPGDCGEGFAKIDKMGEIMAGKIKTAMDSIKTVDQAPFTFVTEDVMMQPDIDMWVTMSAMRIGDTAFVTAPGEPYVEIGLAVKAKAAEMGFPICFVMGVTNDGVGYIIPEDWYNKHVYEALFAIFGPKEGTFFRDRMITLVGQLK